jgi:hypothetical protein
LLDCFDRSATSLGVFDDEEALIGIGVVESTRVGPVGDQMQLAYLYVTAHIEGRSSTTHPPHVPPCGLET